MGWQRSLIPRKLHLFKMGGVIATINLRLSVVSIHTGKKSYFVTAEDTTSNKKTTSYCASMARQAMSDAATKLGCIVRAVVTDNEKKVEVMRRELQGANDDLVVYGCSSHLLNLLGDDLTPQQVTAQVC